MQQLKPISEKFKLQTKIIVGNKTNRKIPRGYRSLNCDRLSVMGNPFTLNNERDRVNVCAAYRVYLRAVVYDNYDPLGIALFISLQRGLRLDPHWRQPTKAMIFEWLNELKARLKKNKVVLYCHCSPKQCHVDEIISLMCELWQSLILD